VGRQAQPYTTNPRWVGGQLQEYEAVHIGTHAVRAIRRATVTID
jgi:hypothetical protein